MNTVLEEKSKYIDSDLKDLFDILMFKRKNRSVTEEEFIKRFIVPTGARPDTYGNYILKIGESNVLWSAHTDTVHKQGGKQKLLIDKDGIVTADNEDCLGADNGAGVWILLELIKAKKPGLYIFHREEEIGGMGSQYIAKKTPNVLDGIEIAIAFDRRNTNSIITFQSFRTCSDEFADSFIAETKGLNLRKDKNGTFTDTANYIDNIRECTNISVGFGSEHSKNEYLNTKYIKRLRDSLLLLDTKRLVVKRNIDDPVEFAYSNSYPYGNYSTYDEIGKGTSSMYELVKGSPFAIVDILKDIGFDYDMLYEEIEEKRNEWSTFFRDD